LFANLSPSAHLKNVGLAFPEKDRDRQDDVLITILNELIGNSTSYSEGFAKPVFCPISSRKGSGEFKILIPTCRDSGFKFTQALILTKIPGFSKPSL